MIWGVVSLVLLLVIIGLTIWLLVRQSNVCPDKKKLNENCSNTTECNSGLVCSASTGVTGGTGNICKVAFGGVCSTSSECGSGLSCNSGICSPTLGTGGQICPCSTGFTCINNICRAIVGRPCTNGTDCASGVCVNNICGITGMDGITNLTPGNNGNWNNNSWNNCSSRYSDESSRCRDSSKYSSRYSSSNLKYSSSRDTDSSKYTSKYSNSSTDLSDSSILKNSRYSDSTDWDNSKKSSLLTCTDTDCSGIKYFKNGSVVKNKSSDTSSDNISDCGPKKCKRRYSTSSLTSNYSSHDSYVRRGVYVTDASNNDRTLFTSIEEPIIDIAKNSNNTFLLLLKDGNLVSNSGTNNTMLLTNKKMVRIIRFGTVVIGLDRKGKLYSRDTMNSMTNTWNWEHLKNYPSDVQFIASTNSPYNSLEVLTCQGKALLYTFSTNWKDGNVVNMRKTRNPRYYGSTISRYIDVNETSNIGKTNDGVTVKHIKGAGFYSSGVLVSVLTEDTFTHVRIIDSNAYFLFEQC